MIGEFKKIKLLLSGVLAIINSDAFKQLLGMILTVIPMFSKTHDTMERIADIREAFGIEEEEE